MKKFEVSIWFGKRHVNREVVRLMVAKDHEACQEKILRSLNLRLGRDRVFVIGTTEVEK